MLGSTIGHYEVVQKLGAGGMGEVYLAEDKTLHRKVALKVLPRELAESPERLGRFEREAQTLAALDHPSIVTIHSVEAAEGIRFLTMAYVEGRTLDEVIPSEGLSAERLLELAVPMADGLRAAHRQGIVHRDLKPGNIMVDVEGRLRILDFGLAKLQEDPELDISSKLATEAMSPAMTREGAILGTYPYMSPEQAEGKTADSRSDLFSLGVVLYEMAAGVRPFHGDTAASLISSILKDTPRPLGEARPELPSSLGEIISRCLEKDPAERYQSAEEALEALKGLRRQVASGTAVSRGVASEAPSRSRGILAAILATVVVVLVLTTLWRSQRARPPTTTPGSKIESLAVLPLANLSGDPEQEYFADGMTEALITDLAKIGALNVISRASVMRFKGSNKALIQIAEELGVEALISGSAVREGDRVGITAQLIDAVTERTLWAERYDRELTSVLTLQGEIAQTIAGEIEVSLTPQEEDLLTRSREIDPEAYEAYLKGTYHINKLTPESIEQGLAYLHEAVEKDPASAQAYAGLALGYSLVASHGPSPPPDAFQRAQAAYLQALELDDTVAEAHAALAETKLYAEWDWNGAAAAFERALELNPNLARAHAQYSWYLNLFHRREEALAEMRRAQRADPLTPTWTAWIGYLNAEVGRYEEAIVAAQQALELDASFARGIYILGWVQDGAGAHEEAIASHLRAVELDPGFRWALARSYVLADRQDEAMALVLELENEGARRSSYGLARIYTTLGDREAAMRWIEKAIEVRHPFAPWLFVAKDVVDLLGGDLRYEELRAQLGIPAA